MALAQMWSKMTSTLNYPLRIIIRHLGRGVPRGGSLYCLLDIHETQVISALGRLTDAHYHR